MAPETTSFTPTKVQQWFKAHVTLDGKPYTLDLDQAKAVCDQHQNTLLVARAGSGKTRVIVAKTIFLVAKRGLNWPQIAIFMFNRAAANEVNLRLQSVKIDGKPASSKPLKIASTFHKFALDALINTRTPVKIISEEQKANYTKIAIDLSLKHRSLSSEDYLKTFQILNSFINRAGQTYPRISDLPRLEKTFLKIQPNSSPLQQTYQRLGVAAYGFYLKQFQPTELDFNQLLARATDTLTNALHPNLNSQIAQLKYILIDEYQDFSLPFFRLVQALKQLNPTLNLFAVGDDWQAINRFAGSDVQYFTNFTQFFPENSAIIPLLTNYRSTKRIVQNANHFMLKNYDPKALPAKIHLKKRGQIIVKYPQKIRVNVKDLKEDGLNDGRFLSALPPKLTQKQQLQAAKLIKQLYLILKRHRHSTFLFLHRNNFTSIPNLDLTQLAKILRRLAITEQILTQTKFDSQIQFLTIHKSKGLEADNVVLLDFNRELLLSPHPYGDLFNLFGDTRLTERADQARLIYVALTRAKRRLYLLTKDPNVGLTNI